MDPDGNRLQNSCSPKHWGHSTMHRVPPVSGTTTTIYMPPHVKYLRYSVHYRVVRLWESSMRCVAFSWADNYCVVCCRPIDVSYLMTTSTLCTARYGPSNLGCQAVNYTPPHYIDQGVHTTTLLKVHVHVHTTTLHILLKVYITTLLKVYTTTLLKPLIKHHPSLPLCFPLVPPPPPYLHCIS